MISVAIIMTVFNRVDKTKKCIDSILKENIKNEFCFSFYITNDGSNDGTDKLLKDYQTNYKDINFNVFLGDGTLFWTKGMAVSYGEALKNKHDYYLWVNNDVTFKEGFLEALIKDEKTARDIVTLNIICGTVCSFDDGEWTYGGYKNLSKTNPYKRTKIFPNGDIQVCDCVNGNCLLIPFVTAQKLGNLDKRYAHAFGDFDYGYKLKANGGKAFVASGYVGYCNRNSLLNTWNDPSLKIVERIKKKNLPNGVPYKSHKLFLQKWFPKYWVYFLWRPYFRICITSLQNKLKVYANKRCN